MVFSSIPFLFFFFPICFILYYAVPFSWKNGILLLFSLIFYTWGEPRYIVLLLFATGVDYINGRLMERYGTDKRVRTIFLCISVIINLSVLAFFKYADFIISTINMVFGVQIKPLGLSLPIGISFYTFQTMSYIIDLYRGTIRAEHSYSRYLTYVSMFPQLVAGPIVRFADVQKELHTRRIDREEVRQGILRFMMGLFKKVLIANRVGVLWEEISALGAGQASMATAWLGALSFTLQLYFDFSAYSDMAIGMGQMLGFHFHENFNYPLTAVSVTDFWRRWHISLSTWFRDYVYIPLGGNRRGVLEHLRNIAIVWFLTGLWHGASWNFVLWGVYYGILLALEKYVWGNRLEKLPGWIRHAYALFIIVFGFVIFAITDAGKLGTYIGLMFGLKGNCPADSRCLWYLYNYGIELVSACVLACPVYPWIRRKVEQMKGGIGAAAAGIGYVMGAAFLLLSVAYLVNDTYNPFLYFRF